MTRRLDHSQLLVREEIVSAPPLPSRQACDDHSFEIPTVLYVAMAGLFLGFVTVLTLGFSAHMAVSYGVIVAFIAAFFGVPAIFVRAKPEQDRTRALRWYDFMDNGIATATGPSSGGEAAILMLLLPVLIFCFGVAVVAIAALVS